jgi:hypothetical protein
VAQWKRDFGLALRALQKKEWFNSKLFCADIGEARGKKRSKRKEEKQEERREARGKISVHQRESAAKLFGRNPVN